MAHRYIELFLNSTPAGGYGAYGGMAGAGAGAGAAAGGLGRAGFNGGQWGDASQAGYTDAAYGGDATAAYGGENRRHFSPSL